MLSIPRKQGKIEQTLIMLKPRPEEYTGQNQDFFENLILKNSKMVDIILKEKKIHIFTEQEVHEHYSHLRLMWFFPKIVEYITSGESRLLLMEGKNAIYHGDTIKKEIRKNFGCQPGLFDWIHNNKPYKNILHASDGINEAQREVERYFEKNF